MSVGLGIEEKRDEFSRRFHEHGSSRPLLNS